MKTEVLLGQPLAAVGEEGDRADRGGLGSLPAGVGVHFGVKHENVDVAVLRHDVVEAAEADVIGPAVTAEDPDRLVDEVVLQLEHLLIDRLLLAFGFLDGGRQKFADLSSDFQSPSSEVLSQFATA